MEDKTKVISIFKNEDRREEFADGYSASRILAETCPEVSLELCTLKSGCSRGFSVYSADEKMQIFVFTAGNGMLRAGKKIFVIDEQSVFIPDFDRDHTGAGRQSSTDLSAGLQGGEGTGDHDLLRSELPEEALVQRKGRRGHGRTLPVRRCLHRQ